MGTAADVQPPEPQPVLTPLTEAAIFLVLTIDDTDVAREVLADVPDLSRAVGFRIPDGELRCVVGIGSECYDRLFAGPRPANLHRLPEIAGDRHAVVSTPGDLLFHIRARRMDLCFELAGQLMKRLGATARVVDETHGFKFFDERDLMGFVDGTENPTGRGATRAAIIDDDPDFNGGSYVVVQKYLHDMDAWNALSVEEQEKVIGRTKLDDIEMSDETKPTDSHVALNTIVDADGTKWEIVRDNMPFGRLGGPPGGEYGTYFIGYAAHPWVIEKMLMNMFIGSPPGNTDHILEFSTPVTGTLFFVPSLDFLDNLPDPPTATTSTVDTSLRIGSLGRKLRKELP